MKSQKQLSKKKSFNQYVKYSAMGFQLIAIVLLAVYAGIKLDEWFHFKFPVMKLSLSLLSVILGIYWMIKSLINK